MTDAPKHVATAFLVVLTENGWEATPDLDFPIRPERSATVPEMKFACQEVVEDIIASKTAAMILQQQMAMTQMMRQQAENQSIRDKLKI
jgi:hypothetical protein